MGFLFEYNIAKDHPSVRMTGIYIQTVDLDWGLQIVPTGLKTHFDSESNER